MSATKPIDLTDEMKESYLRYAEYVIRDRAIPDIRDGLKPVHRRILWGMWEEGCKAGTPYKKSARIVGSVMGKYHPHGDSAIYSAMVRLAQPFMLHEPFVDGKGNFGSVDDPTSFAASRYTEARLSRFSCDVLFQDINENTIDFIDNYDGCEQEPVVLPARLPLALLTSPSGIAVGMATDVPPHNIEEVCQATIDYIERGQLSLAGPDLPLGGLVTQPDFYDTGRGTIQYRCHATFETSNEKTIVIQSLPYGMAKTSMIEDIAKAVNDEKVSGIRDLRDESDSNGVRICIMVEKKADPKAVLNALYKHTRLQGTVAMNAVLIADGQPKQVGLQGIMDRWLEFRRGSVKRRAQHRLEKAQSRMEIIEAVLAVEKRAKWFIDTVRSGRSIDAIRAEIEKGCALNERQSRYVIDMPVRRFSTLDKEGFIEEKKQLEFDIGEHETVIEDATKLDVLIINEVSELRDKYKHDRKTLIVKDFDSIDTKDMVKQEDVVMLFLSDGGVKVTSLSDFRIQKRRGVGLNGLKAPDGVTTDYMGILNTHDEVWIYTDKGNRYLLPMHQFPVRERMKKSLMLTDYIDCEPDEHVVGMTPLELGEYDVLVSYSEDGMLRKLKSEVINRTRMKEVYPVETGGKLRSVLVEKDYGEIVFVANDAKAMRISLEGISAVKSRKAVGVNAFTTESKDVFISSINDDMQVVLVTEQGYGKRIDAREFKVKKGRRGKGYSVSKLSDADKVVFACAVRPDEDTTIMLMTEKNYVIRMFVKDIPERSKLSFGVQLRKMEPGDKIVSVSLE